MPVSVVGAGVSGSSVLCLCCHLKISVLFNLLCVWILFHNVSSQFCFSFYFIFSRRSVFVGRVRGVESSLSLLFCLCLSVSVCLSLSVCLPLCLSVSLCVSLSLSLSVYVCLCVSVSVSESVCLSVCLSLSLCVSLSVSVSVSLSLSVLQSKESTSSTSIPKLTFRHNHVFLTARAIHILNMFTT